MSELLHELDSHARPRRTSTAVVATRDKLFLQYDAQRALGSKSAKEFGNVLDLTTILLVRLRHVQGSLCTGSAWAIGDVVSSFGLSCKKSLANLEHMLECLRHAALEGLVQNSLKRLQGDVAAWYQYWKQRRHSSISWFAEWSSGRRPLSTTWPWNIKPSLFVLWGVCWMFYANGDSTRNPNQADTFPSTLTTRQPPQPSISPYSQSAEAWSDNAFHTNAPIIPWRSEPQAESHSYYASLVGQPSRRDTRFTDYYTLPASTVSASSSPYISASPSTSSASFTTLIQSRPQYQGNHGFPTFAYDQDYNFGTIQQTPSANLTLQPATVANLETATAIYPHAQQPFPDENSRQIRGVGAGGRLPVYGLANTLGLSANNMPNYPSPRSEMSGQSRSSSLSLYRAAETSPNTVPYTTVPPSRKSSTYGSPTSVKSEEPSRNDQGQIYCSHKDCASNPPNFTRKCEWSKHMDKHNRPYVCDERGCEKIQGFTYSGGLLRHQREVHKQHGGPKASCMCPHKDCKRSTGTGFSRRENLIEHLRRVHRGVEEGGEQVATPTPTAGQTRKRRREPPDEAVETEAQSTLETSKRRRTAGDSERIYEEDQAKITADAGDTQDLQSQVKSLQLELQQKDERLRKLEETVARLAGD